MRVAQHWNRLPRVCVESPSWETLTAPLDTLQSDLLWLTCLDRGPFQPVIL